MVNQEILNYLKNGTSVGFTVQRLRDELVKNNFNSKDVDEAIAALNAEQSAAKTENISYSDDEGGAKWMKIAGIIGIIIAILGIAGSIYSFFAARSIGASSNPENIVNTSAPSILATVFLILGFIIGYLILIAISYGFVKMGRKTDSPLLKDSSWGFMFIPLIFLVVSAISYVILTKAGENVLAALTLSGSPTPISLSTLFIIFALVWGISTLFLIVLQLLFSFGLIQSGKQIKFAKIGGIIILIAALEAVVSLIYEIILINQLYQFAQSGKLVESIVNSAISNLSGGSATFAIPTNILTSISILSLSSIIAALLTSAGLLFASIALLYASKKFEK